MTEQPYFIALRRQGRLSASWLSGRGQFANLPAATASMLRCAAAQLRGMKVQGKLTGYSADTDRWVEAMTTLAARLDRGKNPDKVAKACGQALDLIRSAGETLDLGGVMDERVVTLLRMEVVHYPAGPNAWVMLQNSLEPEEA